MRIGATKRLVCSCCRGVTISRYTGSRGVYRRWANVPHDEPPCVCNSRTHKTERCRGKCSIPFEPGERPSS